jgi:mannose-6-phosphate isomerase-like protein (cupin superfamily)
MISRESAPHYQWGEGCDGWHLVKNEALSVIEERMPPGTSERRHLHRRARQFFFVLAGELTMEIEGEEHRLPANHGVEIAPGQAHQAFNRSANDVRFLVVSQPPSHGDRVDA